MLAKIHKALFFFLILIIPINLGKHFIFGWSYFNGVLIDYLIPTLYFSDLITVLLLFVWDLDLIFNKRKYSFKDKVLPVFLTLGIFLVLLAFSVNSQDSIFKLVKYLEMALLFLYTTLNFNFKKDFETLTTLLSISTIFESVVGYLQFLKRGSVFNNFLFFGEQPYSYRTPGINFDNLFGVTSIPPYGTFPHPNVFAGFLVFSLTVILYYTLRHKVKFLNVVAFLSGLVVLVLTTSLNAYLSLLLGISFLLLLKYSGRGVSKAFFYLLAFINLLFLISPVLIKSSQHSIYRRNDLTQASLEMIKAKPFFGVGLNSFTRELDSYGKVRGTIKFIQPVHNIFLLLASESGLPTLLAFLTFVYLLVSKSISKGSNFFPNVLLFELLFLGTFDHYILTIQQGLLLLWLTLGMVLSTIVSHEKSLAQSKN